MYVLKNHEKFVSIFIVSDILFVLQNHLNTYKMAQGDQQQFCLRWNDFQTNMVSSFKHLRDEKSFTDVTLACDGQTCKAHKMVLSACSPYFKVNKPTIVEQTFNFLSIRAISPQIKWGSRKRGNLEKEQIKIKC